jgi:hypothetical protein
MLVPVPRTRNAPAAKPLSRHEAALSASTLKFSSRLITPPFPPSGTLLPYSLQMIMNRRSLTLVHMTQTVAFTVMIMGNPAAASPPRERRPPYWP